jgi:hypothetical protein
MTVSLSYVNKLLSGWFNDWQTGLPTAWQNSLDYFQTEEMKAELLVPQKFLCSLSAPEVTYLYIDNKHDRLQTV